VIPLLQIWVHKFKNSLPWFCRFKLLKELCQDLWIRFLNSRFLLIGLNAHSFILWGILSQLLKLEIDPGAFCCKYVEEYPYVLSFCMLSKKKEPILKVYQLFRLKEEEDQRFERYFLVLWLFQQHFRNNSLNRNSLS